MPASTDSPQVYFFTSRSDAGLLAFEHASKAFPSADWQLHHIETASERSSFEEQIHSPDILVSFLNPYVIPETLLTQVQGRAFNVHPALPDYPGRDPEHFAFYQGATTTGATLHVMTASVDAGTIIDVLEAPVDRAQGVMRFIAESERLSIELLLKTLPAILNNTVQPVSGHRWRPGPPTTRKMFLEMCRLDATMSPEEITKRIDAFFNPEYRSITLEHHGHRFVYEPTTPPPSGN
jgi:methionyl-tRNA formyltransferase